MFKRVRKLFFTILLVLCASAMNAQEWNYARLTLLYGSNIPFNFNSIQKVTEGIEIIDGTILGITLADSNVVLHDLEGFDLNFRAFNGQAVIQGDADDLPLNRIRVRAENSLGLGVGVSAGYQDLDAGWNTLFTYTNTPFSDLAWDTHQLSISYECGKPVSDGGNGSLIGETPDYYTVEIEIELVPTGTGF